MKKDKENICKESRQMISKTQGKKGIIGKKKEQGKNTENMGKQKNETQGTHMEEKSTNIWKMNMMEKKSKTWKK